MVTHADTDAHAILDAFLDVICHLFHARDLRTWVEKTIMSSTLERAATRFSRAHRSSINRARA